jgi:cytochrome oxidase Cu insertion factor (SCO1/SenC/PrrC family)
MAWSNGRVPVYLMMMRPSRTGLRVLLLLACVSGAFSLGIFEHRVALVGTVIPRPAAAPDFTLTDQHGLPFHMAETRGRVVVMTFIYTHCTDLCPFVTMKLKSARDQLGRDADKAVFVAVTTDPARDTQPVIAAYSKAAGLFDDWHFLTGTLPAVKDVWFNYGVGVDIEKPVKEGDTGDASQGSATDAEPTQGLSPGEVDIAHRIVDRFGGGYDVSHSAPYWIIDRQGKIRASMDADALPSQIAANVRALMGR